MKDKVQARADPSATKRGSQPECESWDVNPHPATPNQSDTSLESMDTGSIESTRSNIAQLQRQLLNKMSRTEKTPLQRQRDAFADFMKEITYTFPPSMWLRFQNEANSLLQKYQLELQHSLTSQTSQEHQQQPQQNEFLRPYSPAPFQRHSSEHCPSVGWQPHPSQWPAQTIRPTSVWDSQDASWV